MASSNPFQNVGDQIYASGQSAAGLTASNAQAFSDNLTSAAQDFASPITFPGITLPSDTDLTPQSICGLLSALEAYPAIIVNKLLKKIALLQRIASIIEQAGDILALPSLEALNGILSLAELTIADYNAIRAACCFLHLPPVNDANLLQLIAQLQGALQSLLNLLLEHPWSRLSGLQDELDALIEEAIGAITGDVSGLIQCINALCAAAGSIQAGIDTSNLASFDQTGQAYSSILTPSQSQKAQSVASLQTQLTNLIGTPVSASGFSVGPGSVPAQTTTFVTNTTTTDSEGNLYMNGVLSSTSNTTTA